MGFFDNLLNAVESGALEERLGRVADAIEGASQKVDKKLASAAEKPAEALKVAEDKRDELASKVKQIGGEAKKSIDIVQG